MEYYEVKYEFCSTVGNNASLVCTLKADSPEMAKRIGYNKASKVKPSKGKVKFMYVRKLLSYL